MIKLPADIARCNGKIYGAEYLENSKIGTVITCPKKERCLRFVSEPHKTNQSYVFIGGPEQAENCDSFYPIEESK